MRREGDRLYFNQEWRSVREIGFLYRDRGICRFGAANYNLTVGVCKAPMDFYTVVLRRSAGYWVALCLENGLVGQGMTQDEAIDKLREAIEAYQAAFETEANLYQATISIAELHEFLAIESEEPTSENYEFRAVYA